MIETTKCVLKQEFVSFVREKYQGRPLLKKELRIVVDTIRHECLHAKIYDNFGFKSQCSLNLTLESGKNYGIDFNAECAIRGVSMPPFLQCFTLFVTDITQMIYDIITDLFNWLDWRNSFWRIRRVIVEYYLLVRDSLNYAKKNKYLLR